MYEECPYRANLHHIAKLKPQPPGPALVRGSEIHEHLAAYVTGKAARLKPKTVDALLRKPLAALRKVRTRLRVEQQWAFRKNWTTTEWFSADAWVRLVVDVANVGDATARIIDYKTGKEYAAHDDQLSLYALGAFCRFPDVTTVTVELWYTDIGKIVDHEYDVTGAAFLKKTWNDRARPLLRDRRFVAKPGNHCRWCVYRASEGGPCRY
jgi:RecB family exonuclease